MRTELGVISPAAARDHAPIIWLGESGAIAGAKVIEVMPVADDSDDVRALECVRA